MSSICAWVAKSSPPAARGRCSAAKCVGQKCYRWEGFGENFHLNNYSKPSIQYIMIYVSDDLQWSSMTWHVMTCWNMLKHVETASIAPRIQLQEPTTEPDRIPDWGLHQNFTKGANNRKTCHSVSMCQPCLVLFFALSCQVLRVIVLLPCQQNVCAKQWVWFRRLKKTCSMHILRI